MGSTLSYDSIKKNVYNFIIHIINKSNRHLYIIANDPTSTIKPSDKQTRHTAKNTPFMLRL